MEVGSLPGGITREKDASRLHAHAVAGKRNRTLIGGDLLEAIVRPALEVMLTESPAHLQREFDLQREALIKL